MQSRKHVIDEWALLHTVSSLMDLLIQEELTIQLVWKIGTNFMLMVLKMIVIKYLKALLYPIDFA